ncbi:hypothetical protein A2U01_0046104, partial [Trifolium medium]|nr:hypothetical protein [Trifolium medium]
GFSFVSMKNIVLKLADMMIQISDGKANNEHVSTGERFFGCIGCFYIDLF